jgi:pilus assembly protein CpaF
MRMLTIRVDNGKKSRTYQLDHDQILIGFRSGVHLVLPTFEEDSGELRVDYDDQSGYTVRPQFNPGYFSLNDEAITKLEPLSMKDTITCGPYTLVIEDMELEDEPVTRAFDEEAVSPQQQGRKPGRPSGKMPSAGEYLKLFFGPIAPYLEDDEVSEILINGPKQIYIERKGKLERLPECFDNEAALIAAVKNVAKYIGRMFDQQNPQLDARLPDGSRVHAVIPPMARAGTVVAIRKFAKEALTIEKLIGFGSLNESAAAFIDVTVRAHKNIIVSGATSSGKTSVLNVLSGCIPADERILVIEDSSELQLQQPHTVYFETRKPDERGKGEVTIRDLVHSSLRLRPDRLVIGEIRGGEALDLLQALNTGHAGSMSTIHANGPTACLRRLETCALLSGVDMPLSALRSQVASAVDMVVHTARLTDGSRKVTHISEVLDLVDGDFVTQDIIRYEMEGQEDDGTIIGQHKGCGVLPTFYDLAVMAKLPIKKEWFDLPS